MRQSGLASGRWAARAARRGTQAARSKTAGISAVALEFPTHQLRVLLSVHPVDVVELDVQVLVDRLKDAAQCHVILQLHHHLLALQRREEGEEECHDRVHRVSQKKKAGGFLRDQREHHTGPGAHSVVIGGSINDKWRALPLAACPSVRL